MFESGLLRDKRILVTGGGTGLGLAMGKRFLELGARLAICGRREEVLKQATAQLEQIAPGRVAWQRCDIRDAAAVDSMLDAFWADGPLDALVNNAAGNFIARAEALSPRAIDAVLGIVLHGSAYVTVGCGRRWLHEERPASVLSIITSYAWTGSAYVVPSAMAKAGVLAMTRSLAVEWGGRGVRLNAIAPGPFPTQGAWSGWCPGPTWRKGSRLTIRSAARAGMKSWRTSPPSCCRTAPATSMARLSPSMAASGCKAPASSTSCEN